MSFKKLSNLIGVKNFELYSDFNQFIIQGLSKFKIGYSSNIHLYIPEAIYSSPDYRICYIVSKQNYLEVSEVAYNTSKETRYSVFYELLQFEMEKMSFFGKTKNGKSYIVDMSNIDDFIDILNRIFTDVLHYIEANNIDFEMPNFKELSMDLIITREKMESFFERNSEFKDLSAIKEITQKLLSKNHEFDIFLSHRKLDEKTVVYIWNVLNEEGLSVYIDWIVDENLDRKKVDKNTANILKKRMRMSKCLLYLTTNNSGQSKWMPWELGYFDGLEKKIAIMPYLELTSKRAIFDTQEYLQLYPICYSNLMLDFGERLKDWI